MGVGNSPIAQMISGPMLSGQISIIPKPEFFGEFGEDSLIKPPFRGIPSAGNVVRICPECYGSCHCLEIFSLLPLNPLNDSATLRWVFIIDHVIFFDLRLVTLPETNRSRRLQVPVTQKHRRLQIPME